MILLTSVNDKLQLITSSAARTTVHVSWVDNASGVITPGRTNTAITSATTTDVLASPAVSHQITALTWTIRNEDGAVSQTVTPLHTDGTTVVKFPTVTLAAGEFMQFVDGEGWRSFDATGSMKVSYAPVGASTLTGTVLASNVVTSSLTTIGTLVAGAVPASLVTAGAFGGASGYTFPAGLTLTGALSGVTTLGLSGVLTSTNTTSGTSTTAAAILGKSLGLTENASIGGTLAVTGTIDAHWAVSAMLTGTESWIGPSATTGMYFKNGRFGFGTISPRALSLGLSGAYADVDGGTAVGALTLHGFSSTNPLAELSLGLSSNGVFIDSTGHATAANNSITFRVTNTASSNTVVTDALVIKSTGDLTAGAGLVATTGFGCNGKTAQTAYASGGLLAGVVAALVANGILSN